jgi:hypothetical protein
MPIQESDSRDPKVHTATVRKAMKELIDHLRRNVERVDEPRAQALFETSAEVLKGLVQTYDDYDAAEEPAFRRPAAVGAR